MNDGDFGLECENCECLSCIRNESKCTNCNECNGNTSYDKWMMDCEKYKSCKNPEEITKIILGNII